MKRLTFSKTAFSALHSPAAFVLLFIFQLGLSLQQAAAGENDLAGARPNILFYITDDQSWLHTSLAGNKVVRTPAFDRVAREGIHFINAFVSAPSCAPARASILTGRYPWQLQEGVQLFGGIPRTYRLFTHLLEDAGYESAMAYKGYWPGNMVDEDYHETPLGKSYNVAPQEPYPEGIAPCDYAASFGKFLEERDVAKPFFFWMGTSEPHRLYHEGIGRESGLAMDSISVPAFLPDHPVVRSDLLDYVYEINHQDEHLSRILRQLEAIGELDRTIIVVTSDNGMPFPRAKTSLYDYGTRVPLAVRWGDRIKSGRIVEDITNLAELAPTFLELAGVDVPTGMRANSLLNVLASRASGVIDPMNNYTVTAMERHSLARKGGLGYPMRALRTQDWLLVRNFEPERWPAGDPPPFKPIFYDDYGDVDEGPSKRYIVDNRHDEKVEPYFDLGFAKRPEYELYHIPTDPDNVRDLSADYRNAQVLSRLKLQLNSFLKREKDPRMVGDASFDDMPFYLLGGGDAVRVDRDSHPNLF